jgi:hypothetical protein
LALHRSRRLALVRVAKWFSRHGIVHSVIGATGIKGKIVMFREIAVLVCDRKAEKTLVASAAGNAGFCRYTSSPDLRPLRPFMWQPIIFDPGTAMVLLAFTGNLARSMANESMEPA